MKRLFTAIITFFISINAFSQGYQLESTFTTFNAIPHNICVDSKGNMFVFEFAMPDYRYVNVYDKNGTKSTSFTSMDIIGNGVYDFAIFKDSIFYINSDFYVKRLGVGFDTKFPLYKANSTIYYTPQALTVSQNNNFWLGIYSNTNGTLDYFVQKYNTAKQYVTAWGNGGTIKSIGGIATDSKGNIWISDTKANNLIKFDSTGTVLARYGATGNGPVQFSTGPGNIKIDNQDNIFVVDAGNSRIQKINSNGTFLSEIADINVSNLWLDNAGTVYVTSSVSKNIYKYTPVLTSLDNDIKSTAIAIFPNPSADGKFKINTEENISSIKVTNALGQNEIYYNTKEFSTLLKGLLVVQVTLDNNNTITSKVIAE